MSVDRGDSVPDCGHHDDLAVRIELEGHPTNKFLGQLIFFTGSDVTIRRPSGAILVIDNYEIVALTGTSPSPHDLPKVQSTVPHWANTRLHSPWHQAF